MGPISFVFNDLDRIRPIQNHYDPDLKGYMRKLCVRNRYRNEGPNKNEKLP